MCQKNFFAQPLEQREQFSHVMSYKMLNLYKKVIQGLQKVGLQAGFILQNK